MADVGTYAGLLNGAHLGKTIKFTTASGFHEYYELIAVWHEPDKVLITVRARRADDRYMLTKLANYQPVVVSDVSNDKGIRPPFNWDFE